MFLMKSIKSLLFHHFWIDLWTVQLGVCFEYFVFYFCRNHMTHKPCLIYHNDFEVWSRGGAAVPKFTAVGVEF